MTLAYCIGCRCHDRRACVGGDGIPCHWLAVDYAQERGVCSSCAEHLGRWSAGERQLQASSVMGRGDQQENP